MLTSQQDPGQATEFSGKLNSTYVFQYMRIGFPNNERNL